MVEVTIDAVREGVRRLGLGGLPLCVHSSLRSFGRVGGGAQSVVDGLLLERCTVLVPAESSRYAVWPPPTQRPPRNGRDYDAHAPYRGSNAGAHRIYTPDSPEIDPEMGAIPGTVVATPGRRRGNHPLFSFAAVGPLAADLIAHQSPRDVFAPLRALADRGGYVLLMGVGLDTMTLIHLAEARAGRHLFRRWANGPDGQPMMVDVGGCLQGFPKLDPFIGHLASETTVGESVWRAFPAEATLREAAWAICRFPNVTCCDEMCERCVDALAGGPILQERL